jgi:uncharacterized membrane protein
VDVRAMTEGSTGSPARPRIQSLSDLIFGLALSIGALTLIGQKPSDFQGLVLSILYYGFSFLILINIWRSYTRTMSLLPVETAKLINLNILLLFLVSIEPYLFNQLLASSLVMAQNVSILYAFDLGGLIAIQAFFTNSLISEKKKSIPEQLLREYKFRRTYQLIIAVIFFVSTIPVFWTWRIELSNTANIPLRLVFWFIALFLSVLGYRWIEPKTGKRKSQLA